MSDLRDHSQPCEHGSIHPHWFDDGPMAEDERSCPGGREVTIDYEAAEAFLVRLYPNMADPTLMAEVVYPIVAAAIGDTDEESESDVLGMW